MQGAPQRPECPSPAALPSQPKPSSSTCGQDHPAVLHCHPGEGGVFQAWVLPRRAGKGGRETKKSLVVHEKGTNVTSWHSLSWFSAGILFIHTKNQVCPVHTAEPWVTAGTAASTPQLSLRHSQERCHSQESCSRWWLPSKRGTGAVAQPSPCFCRSWCGS